MGLNLYRKCFSIDSPATEVDRRQERKGGMEAEKL